MKKGEEEVGGRKEERWGSVDDSGEVDGWSCGLREKGCDGE